MIHGALEIVVKALIEAGCASTHSAEAVAVLRALGGYTKVAEGVLAGQFAGFEGNPRLSRDRRGQLIRQLTDWVPQAREQLQTYLNRMELKPSNALGSRTTLMDPTDRYPARIGDHVEKQLVAESLRLTGRIDLLSVDTDGVEITDFKTGIEDPAHQDQLQLYALLWAEDDRVNPHKLAITKLVAAYPSHEVMVAAPRAEELTSLRSEVAERISAADAAVTEHPPTVNLGDHCGSCSVRGLCNPYWAERTKGTGDVPEETWYDLAGMVVREHGVKSFVLREARTNAPVLLRTPTPSYAMPIGKDVRILGVRRVVDPDSEHPLIAELGSMSEVIEMMS